MVKKILKSYDYTLIIAIILLCTFGLVMIYSSSMASTVQRYGYQSDYFYQKQKVWLLAFTMIFLFMAIVPYKIMKFTKILVLIVLASIVLLLGLFMFGQVKNNAQSWYQIGSFLFQPSEFVKLAVIIYLAAVYAKKQAYINQFNKGVLPPLVYLFIVCALIIFQPDFGTAFIIMVIASMIILCSGMNFKSIAKLVILALIILLPIILVSWGKFFSDEQLSRFAVLENPFSEKYIKDEGFHLANSYIAIGSGGVNGLGLGRSIQKLGYLPESHTDFIMAVIAEELGIWGVGFVIFLLGYVVLRGIYIGLQCKDPFGSLLAIGISSMIGIQTFINLAGVSGLIPLTGVPLPYISYGGSSLLMLGIATGILVNVSMFTKYEKKYKDKQEHGVKKKNSQDGKVYYIN
ncbi:FtsW/RodA/SpoVE family cell cycle protein [Neobacillus sp. MM2021_6]|uniref:FtsW/RodA/SpoVE family cell cycle protein n=1 Tax=Bacillaceae TaxID=186817 RepID=UPI00140CEDA7|nr:MULTISPECIES: FtsW/RodA/SpoVE family cell cycle protein [Bacillaceae]MBO0962579.1 FtsW/RodA/SpoVE family cell cycle protein [Neobacillus sp. MM2021_6]NHC16830.1 FtsW/RodA/SpoVE family cell cycle protein [Bacillus sp. MM2020_4]